jgi:hypothetical protein
MHVEFAPPSPVQQGDVLVRPKKSGLGYHYGTGLSNGLVKNNTPELGKHLTTFGGFQNGLPAWIIRPHRTPVEKVMVEQRALSNVGDPYRLLDDNCEHDMTFAQTGTPNSPTVNEILTLVGILVTGALIVKQRHR